MGFAISFNVYVHVDLLRLFEEGREIDLDALKELSFSVRELRRGGFCGSS